ncbi:MAG: DUF1616 domain-containing protein [Thermoplasmata archaeon]|nr:DUF1616 domain-containing protein [Thermoplasmata archaeon]
MSGPWLERTSEDTRVKATTLWILLILSFILGILLDDKLYLLKLVLIAPALFLMPGYGIMHILLARKLPKLLWERVITYIVVGMILLVIGSSSLLYLDIGITKLSLAAVMIPTNIVLLCLTHWNGVGGTISIPPARIFRSKLFYPLLIWIVLLSLVAASVLLELDGDGEPFTLVSLLSPSTGFENAIQVNESRTYNVVVICHEGEDTKYLLEVVLQDVEAGRDISWLNVTFDLLDGEERDTPFQISPGSSGQYRLEAQVYVNGNTSPAYTLSRTLWAVED